MHGAPSQTAPGVRPADRRGGAPRRIAAAWRRLTGGPRVRDARRRTLIACSGGADSSALAIVLAGVRPRPVIGHILHDLRPPEEARRDRDAAEELAAALGLEFAHASVGVREGPGNAEARARSARYEALDGLARSCGLPYIATAHHGDDQLETVLMRLMRGAGPTGLSGIAPVRPLAHARVVRPMLGVGRAEAVEICRCAGWAWREDATNADTTRLRAALRARVTPVLRELSPGVEARLGRSVRLLRDAGQAVALRAGETERAGREGPGTWRWDRAVMAAEPGAVIGAALQAAAGGPCVPAVLGACVRAVLGGVAGERVFDLGPAQVRVTGGAVWLRSEDPQ